MNEDKFKKLWDNPPKDSKLAILKEAMVEGIADTINSQIKELMTNYSLTPAEAMSILAREWEKQNKE